MFDEPEDRDRKDADRYAVDERFEAKNCKDRNASKHLRTRWAAEGVFLGLVLAFFDPYGWEQVLFADSQWLFVGAGALGGFFIGYAAASLCRRFIDEL
jgi:hypothetical protein